MGDKHDIKKKNSRRNFLPTLAGLSLFSLLGFGRPFKLKARSLEADCASSNSVEKDCPTPSSDQKEFLLTKDGKLVQVDRTVYGTAKRKKRRLGNKALRKWREISTPWQ